MSSEKPKKESVKEELKGDFKKVEEDVKKDFKKVGNKLKRKPKAQAPVKPEEKK